MPIEINDCDDGIGVTILGRGSITDRQWLDEFKKHLTQEEANFKKYRYSLSDYSAATEVDVSNASIQAVAKLCVKASKINPYPVVAIVAPSDLAFGLSRMAEIMMTETYWATEVFRSRQEAVKWIKEEVNNRYGIEKLSLG